MKIVVGLGNPGLNYQYTRHNAGYLVVTELAIKAAAPFSNKKDLFCELAKTKIAQHEALLIRPLTFMNDSGKCVQAILHWYKLTLADLLIVHDDVSLPLGRLRLQKDGGAGGQHGVESIIEYMGGARNFNRLKIGVGPDPGGDRRADYVLARPPESQRDLFDSCLKASQQAAIFWVEHGITEAMNQFNGLNFAEPQQEAVE